MNVNITGIGLNSPTGNGLQTLQKPKTNKDWLSVVKPDFEKYFAKKDARRTSRILKMSLVAAFDALNENYSDIDGIIVGTGIGCISDSEKFLVSLIKYNEKTLSPTPFIQSTHNTIAANIALKLKVHQYNFTYSERTFSFEWTLIDAMMRMAERKEKSRYLVGSADELTQRTFNIAEALKLARPYNETETDILSKKYKSPFIGEHATFFTLSNDTSTPSFGTISFVKLMYKQTYAQQIDTLQSALDTQGISHPDCLLIGINGHKAYDKVYDSLLQNFSKSQVAYYKHLCGDSFTSSSYALWLSTEILKHKQLQPLIVVKSNEKSIKNVLILNHFRRDYFSAIFIKI